MSNLYCQFCFIYIIILGAPDITIIVNQWSYIINIRNRMEVCIFNILTSIYILIFRLTYVLNTLSGSYTYNEQARVKMQCPLIFINLGLSIYVNFVLIRDKSLLDLNTIGLVSFFSISLHLFELFTSMSSLIRSRRVHPLPTPVTPELKEITYNEPQNCCICLDDFSEGVFLECHHSFHKPCIVKWLETKKACPLCRIQV